MATQREVLIRLAKDLEARAGFMRDGAEQAADEHDEQLAAHRSGRAQGLNEAATILRREAATYVR